MSWPEDWANRPEASSEPASSPLSAAVAGSVEAQADQQIWQLRAACFAVVRELVEAGPDLVVVVGGGSGTRTHPDWAAGSLRDLGVPFMTGEGEPSLPLSLTVGGWLIRYCLGTESGPQRHGEGLAPRGDDLAPGGVELLPRGGDGLARRDDDQPGPGDDLPLRGDGQLGCEAGGQATRRADGQARPLLVKWQEVAQSWPAAQCLALGQRLAAAAGRVALLVMGDGSARKALGVPGAGDPQAELYDSQVAAALATGDVGALASLDPRLDGEMVVAGRAAWQVLAGAAAGTHVRGQLRYAAAPLDVSYFVASWRSG